MNHGIRAVVAAALGSVAALGSSAALAQTLGNTSNGPGSTQNLVLFVEDEESNGTARAVYALNTGINIDSLLPTTDLSANASVKQINGIGPYTIAESGTLSSFLSGVQSGDTVVWAVEGGYYNDSGSTPTLGDLENQGASKAVFSSVLGTTNHTKISGLTAGSYQTLLTTYFNDSGSVSAFASVLAGISSTATEATSTANGLTWSANDQAKAGILGNGALADVGTEGSTVVDLFGLTGNGSSSSGGSIESYLLAAVTFNNGVLTITPFSASTVPLPAAAWLLGSGLMALVGLSRRRRDAAAAVSA